MSSMVKGEQVRLVEIAVNSVSLYHCKNLEVDLTLENIISVAVWVHLGLGSGPPPFAMVWVTSLV